jgi:hypothetical protein
LFLIISPSSTVSFESDDLQSMLSDFYCHSGNISKAALMISHQSLH